jgi:hypothetical protein
VSIGPGVVDLAGSVCLGARASRFLPFFYGRGRWVPSAVLPVVCFAFAAGARPAPGTPLAFLFSFVFRRPGLAAEGGSEGGEDGESPAERLSV